MILPPFARATKAATADDCLSLCPAEHNSYPTTLLTITTVQYTKATSAPATSPMDWSGLFSMSNFRLNQLKPRPNRAAIFGKDADTKKSEHSRWRRSDLRCGSWPRFHQR